MSDSTLSTLSSVEAKGISRAEMIFPTGGFDGIVFDFDGTLVDSMPAHFMAWQEAMKKHGVGDYFTEEVFYSYGGVPTVKIIELLKEKHGLDIDPVTAALDKREAFLKYLHEVEIIDPVMDFLRLWEGEVPMAIATGGSRPVVEATMDAIGMENCFDAIVTANDVKNGKPAPDIFLEAAHLIGVAPTRCLALEDAPAGVEAAALAGMTVLTVPLH